MPLLRYFVFVGGTLLALLFISDAVLPTQPLPSFMNVASSEPSFVRIRSERKWPERIVFDTSMPMVKPVAIAEVQGEAAPKSRVREAFAQIAPPVSKTDLKTADVKTAGVKTTDARIDAVTAVKPDQAVAKVAEARPQQPKRKVAKARPSRPMMLVAQQPHFGLFDSTW